MTKTKPEEKKPEIFYVEGFGLNTVASIHSEAIEAVMGMAQTFGDYGIAYDRNGNRYSKEIIEKRKAYQKACFEGRLIGTGSAKGYQILEEDQKEEQRMLKSTYVDRDELLGDRAAKIEVWQNVPAFVFKGTAGDYQLCGSDNPDNLPPSFSNLYLYLIGCIDDLNAGEKEALQQLEDMEMNGSRIFLDGAGAVCNFSEENRRHYRKITIHGSGFYMAENVSDLVMCENGNYAFPVLELGRANAKVFRGDKALEKIAEHGEHYVALANQLMEQNP